MMELESPGGWEWTLLLPSLIALVVLSHRGLRMEEPGPAVPRWSVVELLLVVLLVQFTPPFVIMAFEPLMDRFVLPETWSLGLTGLLGQVGSVMVLLLTVWLTGHSLDTLGLRPPRRVANVLAVVFICAAFLLPCSILSWGWLELLVRLGHEPILQKPLELYVQSLKDGDWVGVALIALGAVVVAPVAEELLFRGFVYGILRVRIGPPGALLLTSAAFSLVHQFPEAIVPIFVVGLALNWIYEKTGSLAYPILFHALFNSTVLVYGFLVPRPA